MDNKGNKKKKVNYNVLFVPDNDSGTVKHLSVRLETMVIFFAAVAFLVVAALAYCFILSDELNTVNSTALTLKTQVDTLTEQNSELVSENESLQEKVAILSDTVNDKVQQEEERAQTYVPTGFPIKGTVSYNEDETEIDGNPAAIFNASKGTSVIATANGTVSSIAGSAEDGYIVMVDHGNGYYSVYRNGSKPKVSEGDEVTSATEIYNIETGHEELGYQIIQDNKYIDPLELMEIYG